MATPTRDVVEQLAPHVVSAAHHEAGHAVVALALGLPVRFVEIGYQRSWSGWWSVAGVTRVPAKDPAEDLALVFLAGAAAELRLGCSETHGKRDLAAARRYLARCSLTMGQAQRRVERLVADRWSGIARVAAELHPERRLSGHRIRRLAGM